MTMLYSFHENIEFGEEETHFEFIPASTKKSKVKRSEIHLFTDKLRVPVFEQQILRPRLNELLAKSLSQFGATLITGRAGTGKTALAADFARQYQKVSWYSIDSSESDWEIFSQYFTASFNEKNLSSKLPEISTADSEKNLEEIAYFTEVLMSEISELSNDEPHLIVLDDLHHLFDSDWFTTFFTSLVFSLSPNTHLLMMCRGTPCNPLWRLRSKQVLGVIDEKVLNFNSMEAHELLSSKGFKPEIAKDIYDESFGRILKIKQLTKNYTNK